jgi:hypothetical protein
VHANTLTLAALMQRENRTLKYREHAQNEAMNRLARDTGCLSGDVFLD